jgi:RNA recognition motif-containing protein
MPRLWLGNIERDASDDEIREFLEEYGFPAFDR